MTFSNSCAFDASCRRELKKRLFCFVWNHPKSVMHVRSMLWFDRLAASTPYVTPSTPSHGLICSRKRSPLSANTSSCTGLRYLKWWFQTRIQKCFVVRFLCGHVCLRQWVHMGLAIQLMFSSWLSLFISWGSRNIISSICVANSPLGHAESEVSWHQSYLNLRQM